MTRPDVSAASETAARLAQGWPSGAPGGAIVGFDAGGLRFAAAGGAARLPEALPFDARTVVRWASVTKHVFAATVLRSGLLPLDTRLGEVLAELAPAPASVRVREALAMQGGLPDTRECLTLLGLDTTTTTAAAPLLTLAARIHGLNAPPGTEVAYSNAGYRLVEAALERRGLAFGPAVAEEAARLGTGMRASDHWSDPVRGLVPGYMRRSDDSGAIWAEGHQGMHLSAAGALSGSAEDLAVWLADLAERAEFAAMAAPVPLADGRPTGYGLGLRLTEIGGRIFPGHGGSQPGYRAGFLIDPESRAGVVVVTNREDGDAAGVAQAVMAALLRLDHAPERAGDWAPPGLYAAEDGSNLWLEARPGAAVIRDAEEPLFAAKGGWAVSRAAQSPVRLRAEGEEIAGEIGHRPCRLRPARAEPAGGRLDGLWTCEGALLAIEGEEVLWGRGPQSLRAGLAPLGGGRWLFGTGGRRICLRELAPGRIELSLSRARVIEYRRIATA